MAELTNLTDRIAHLRDRKLSTPSVPTSPRAPKPAQKTAQRTATSERKLASDFFMWFAYGLLAVALIAQAALLVWLDII